MFDKSCKNLLVRGVNWIGDSIMTIPALRALRKGMPEAKISLLVKPSVSAIFENDPNIDELIIYGDEFNGMLGKIKLSSLLNRKKFCGSILFQNAFEAALITFLAGIKERAGYDRDGRGFLLTTPIPVPNSNEREHQIYYYLRLLTQLGLKAEFSYPYLYIKLDDRLKARDTLKDMKRPILGINPGATYGSAKRWLPERFAEVIDWFVKDTGGSVVIFGSKSEVQIADEIGYFVMRRGLVMSGVTSHQSLMKMQNDKYPVDNRQFLMSLSGKTKLRDLISLISECDVLVSNDTGPMHIAYAVRTPLVAIFGSTDPKLTGPPKIGKGTGNMVISSNMTCSPCFERTCKTNDMKCMYEVSSDDVYYGIKQVLPSTKAVFFDRDGTLCEDTGYINRHEQLRIFPQIERLKILKTKGFKIVGLTNQSGIARGIVDEEFVKETNEMFKSKYGFDDFYYCPHHPDDHCPCRKPEPEMILKAKNEHAIDLKHSYVVGDKDSDMLLAKAVGAKGILVQTGEAKESHYADFIARDLKEAIDFIESDSDKLH